jgi:FKBP-type peptidyl-prolyl cis-trans isomerase
MHSGIKFLALAILSSGFYSCAQEEDVSARAVEDRVIQAYVQQNKITTAPTTSGLYVTTVKEGTGVTPAITDWVMIRFTGKTLSGDYFHTTEPKVLNDLGYNTNYFHLVPDYLYMAGAMPQGFREALQMMKEGGKVDLLIPSYLGFGAYGAIKFGQMPILSNVYVEPNRPVKYELELVKVVTKPREYDSLMVIDYVNRPENAGFKKIKDNIYIKEIVAGSTAKADTIGSGSTAYVHYAGYFLDGYCFDTNIKTISDLFAPYAPYGNPNSSSSSTSAGGDTLAVSVKASGRDVVEGFDIALRNLKKGSEAEVIFTSTLGYGATGQSSSTAKPSIAPYTPLRFFIKIDRVSNPTSSSTTSIARPPLLLRKN